MGERRVGHCCIVERTTTMFKRELWGSYKGLVLRVEFHLRVRVSNQGLVLGLRCHSRVSI